MKLYCLFIVDMGVKDLDDFGDSLLVVQQIKGEFQCFDGLLNSYLDRCLDIIKSLDTFTIHHIPREENSRANCLAQQASGYHISKGMFFIIDKPMHAESIMMDTLPRGALGPNTVEQLAVQCTADSVHGSQMTELANKLELSDWRVPLVNHLKDPSQTRDRKIRRQALKYTLFNDELYHRTIDGLFLKCMDSD